MTAEAAPDAVRVPFRTKVYYGLGAAAFGIQDQGLRAFLLLYYSQVVGLNPALVATVLMVSTLVDGFIDPFIGQMSDNLRSRFGRRHPFMYVAAIPSTLLFVALWYPPEAWNDGQKLAYMAAVLISLRAIMSVYEIPNIAQGPELTADYHERTSLLSYRYFFFFLAGAALTFFTYLVLLQPSAEYPVGQLNPEGYKRYALVAGLLMLMAMVISALGTHRNLIDSSQAIKRHAGLGEIVREVIATFSNRPFLMVTGAGVMKSMALGTSGSLLLYFSTYYWGLSAREISILVIDGTIAAFLASVIARPVSARLGKKTTAILFYVLSYIVAIVPITLRYFGLFVENGSPLLVPLLFTVGLIYGTLGIGATIMTSSMIADVVENSQLSTGRRSEGLIFSASSIVNKSVSGLGILTAGLILSTIDFPAGASPGEVPPETVASLALYVPIVGVLYFIGALLLSRYPINRAMHEATLAELRERRGAISQGTALPEA